jgi:hypothetical protein
MLSISDDDSPKEGTPKQDMSKVSSDDAVDPAVKPNFVYIVSINTIEMLSSAVGHIDTTSFSEGLKMFSTGFRA